MNRNIQENNSNNGSIVAINIIKVGNFHEGRI